MKNVIKVAAMIRPLGDTAKISLGCRKVIRKYALGSGIGSAIPFLGADIAADAILATAMLNEIVGRFGLSRRDIDLLDLEARAVVLQAIKVQGCELVGKVITKRIVLRITAKSGVRTVARRFGKFLPVVGQIMAAGIGYATMTALGDMIVSECVGVRQYLPCQY